MQVRRGLNHIFPFRCFLVGLPGPAFFFPQSIIPVRTWGDLKGSLPSCFGEVHLVASDLNLLSDLRTSIVCTADFRFSVAINFFGGEEAILGSADLLRGRWSSFWKSSYKSSTSWPCGFRCTPSQGGIPSDALPLCTTTTLAGTSSWDVHSSSCCEFRYTTKGVCCYDVGISSSSDTLIGAAVLGCCASLLDAEFNVYLGDGSAALMSSEVGFGSQMPSKCSSPGRLESTILHSVGPLEFEVRNGLVDVSAIRNHNNCQRWREVNWKKLALQGIGNRFFQSCVG